MASQSRDNSLFSYIGSLISIISKSEVRYEGVINHLNPNDATIILHNVRTFGTEGRRTDGLQVPPSDTVHQFMLFRGSDIKDVQVHEIPPAERKEQFHNDPSIIQWQDNHSPPLFYHSVTQDGLYELFPPIQNVNFRSSNRPMYVGNLYNMTSIGASNYPQSQFTVHQNLYPYGFPVQHAISPIPLALPYQPTSPTLTSFPSRYQGSNLNEANLVGNAGSEPGPYSASWFSGSNLGPSLTPSSALLSPNRTWQFGQQMDSFTATSSTLIPSTVPLPIFSRQNLTEYYQPTPPTFTSFLSHYQGLNLDEANIVGNVGSEPGPYSASWFSGSSLGLSLTPSTTLLSPNQAWQFGQQMHSFTSTSSSLIPSITPLPIFATQSVQFIKEFDFETMNEKFNKEEIWGSLGKEKQIINHDTSNQKPPVYDQDDFSDIISYNSFYNQTRNMQSQFLEPMKQDQEVCVRINDESKAHGVDRANHVQGKDDHVVDGHAHDKVDDQVITSGNDCQVIVDVMHVTQSSQVIDNVVHITQSSQVIADVVHVTQSSQVIADVVQVTQSSVGVEDDPMRNNNNECTNFVKDEFKATTNVHTCVVPSVQTSATNATQASARNVPNTHDKVDDQVITSGNDCQVIVDVVQLTQSSVGAEDDPVRNNNNECTNFVKDEFKATTNVHTCVVPSMQTSATNATQATAGNVPNTHDKVDDQVITSGNDCQVIVDVVQVTQSSQVIANVVQVTQSSVGVEDDPVRSNNNECTNFVKDEFKATTNVHTCVVPSVQTSATNATQASVGNVPNTHDKVDDQVITSGNDCQVIVDVVQVTQSSQVIVDVVQTTQSSVGTEDDPTGNNNNEYTNVVKDEFKATTNVHICVMPSVQTSATNATQASVGNTPNTTHTSTTNASYVHMQSKVASARTYADIVKGLRSTR